MEGGITSIIIFVYSFIIFTLNIINGVDISCMGILFCSVYLKNDSLTLSRSITVNTYLC